MKKQRREEFADLKKKMFAPRNALKELPEDGEFLSGKGVETVTVADIKKFLQCSAESHKAYFQYSRIGALRGMLQSKRLYLSRLSEMNDIDEFSYHPDAEKIYVACLSFGSMEYMAMWRTQGGVGDDAVRLQFAANEVKRYLSKQHPVFIVKELGSGPSPERGDEIPADEIGYWSFHDVAYKYGKALMWNHQVVGNGRCHVLNDVWKAGLAGFVKSFGWMTENEVRLLVKLKHAHNEWKHIAVDFGDAIEGATIMTGPERLSKEERVKWMLDDVGAKGMCITPSKYRVNFKRDGE